jgi:multidrug transporter EmrE-like cation transporter
MPLYVAYAVAGTSAAGLAKAAIGRAGGRDWRGAGWRSACAGALLTAQFAMLTVLLSRADIAVMVPIANGVNLLTAAAIGIVAFGERMDGWKLAGFVAIAAGIWLVSTAT